MPTIASLNVNLTASIAQFNKNMQSASKRISDLGATFTKFGSSMSIFGGAVTGALGLAVNKFAETGDALDEMSTRTGIATESLSALTYAASFSSISMDQIGSAIGKMQRNLVESPKKFEELGINLEKFAKLKPEEQMAQLADAINRLPTAAQKTAAAMGVFGKSGAELLPFLAEGSEGINRLTKEAGNLGLVMDSRTAKAAAAMDDAMTRASSTIGALVVRIGAALAPTLTRLLDKIMAVTPVIVDWVNANSELVIGVGAAGIAMTALGIATTVFGTALKGIGLIISVVSTGITAFTAVIRVLTLAIAANPIGALVVALTALASWFLLTTDYGKQLSAWIVGGFTQAFQFASKYVTAAIDWISQKLGALWGYIRPILESVGLLEEKANAIKPPDIPNLAPMAPAQVPNIEEMQPSLIEAGNQAAMNFAASFKDDNAKGIEANTKDSATSLKEIKGYFQNGLNVNMTVVEAFA